MDLVELIRKHEAEFLAKIGANVNEFAESEFA